jgi:hypothetical protein
VDRRKPPAVVAISASVFFVGGDDRLADLPPSWNAQHAALGV